MINLHRVLIYFSVVFLLLFAFSANADQDQFRMPGTTQGTGTRFEITDSEYLNVTVDSSEEISARVESAPEMIVLEIEASEDASFANVTISGLAPGTTYHKYEDDYHNYEPLVSDENGTASFSQNLSQNHLIFIQPRQSTKYITDDATGGVCEELGDWNASLKTCTLDQDVGETVQIDSDGITLDGNDHTIAGKKTGSGVFTRKSSVTVKNITVNNFYYGVNLSYSANDKIVRVNASNNRRGIYLSHSSNAEISDNIVTPGNDFAIILDYSANNSVYSNVAGPGNGSGIWQQYGGGNTYENNDASNNSDSGIVLHSGNNNVLRNNKANNNVYHGISIGTSEGNAMTGNAMSGNFYNNFFILTGDLSKNDIDLTNTVEGKPIHYIKNASDKTFDNSADIGAFYCINCENITLKNARLSDKGAQIYFWHTNNSLIENVTSPDKNIELDLSYSSNNTIKRNTFGSMEFMSGNSNDNQIYNNNFMGTYPIYLNSSSGNLFNLDLPEGGNYWKTNQNKCKNTNDDKICDVPFTFTHGADNFPWIEEFSHEPIPEPASCCSSVMFLPGHQASRLYRKDSFGGEDQLWEATNRNQDVRQLHLNADGTSVDPDIYTRDVIDKAYGVFDVYLGFMESMNQMVTDKVIQEWKPIPYDWRMPLEEIIENGVKLENGGHTDIIGELKSMAAASKSGKVTLIGHSNGGLLAKALIEKLKETGGEKMIDKVILVATPQLGTPKALAGLLHGDEINYFPILNSETARGFAENMTSAYNLLSSREYFNIVQSPVVEFDEDVKEIYDFRALYGENIDSWDEFKKFLLGDNGARAEPEENDTDSPNVLREMLLNKSEETHNKLDDWQAPEDMEVIQIAGWGLDTIRGIEYDDCDIPFCPDRLSNLDRSLLLTIDGDKTVVSPSATTANSGNKYYLNLKKHNEELYYLRTNRDHGNILEADELIEFIQNIIQDKETIPRNISQEKPQPESTDKWWRFRLHSPVSINLKDENGNHTGLIENPDPSSDLQLFEEQIPNSYYWEFGEKKYAGSTSATGIVLTGEDLGTFTFEVDEVARGETVKTSKFADIPVMKDLKATLSVSDIVGEMKIDADNDGQEDFTIQAGDEPKEEDLLGILEKIVGTLDINKAVKNSLVNKLKIARKQMEKDHKIAANALLEAVKWEIRVFSKKQIPKKLRIPENEAEKLIKIIDQIQAVDNKSKCNIKP